MCVLCNFPSICIVYPCQRIDVHINSTCREYSIPNITEIFRNFCIQQYQQFMIQLFPFFFHSNPLRFKSIDIVTAIPIDKTSLIPSPFCFLCTRVVRATTNRTTNIRTMPIDHICICPLKNAIASVVREQ